MSAVGILREVREELRRHHAIGLVAGIDALQPVEAGEQQPRADEQDHRDADLRDDEGALQPLAAAALAAGALAPCFIAPARSTREAIAGSVPNSRPVTIETPTVNRSTPEIEADLAGARREARHERREQANRQAANSSPKRPPAKASRVLSVSSCRTRRARPAPSAGADGELAVAAQQAREREVGHVGARDQQHQAGRAEQDQQHRPRVPRHLLADPGSRRGEARAGAIRGLVVRGEAPADHVDVGGGALAGHARLQLAEDVEDREHAGVLADAPLRRGAERARRGRHVDVVLLRIVRHVGQHADYGVRPIVHLEHLADDVAVAAELPLPVASG